jgi:leucyl-tRNA synthetase
LHVGHPLGYIASDIYARYKRHKGFNVLHPMGYDSFGLPAEQYAIQTGQHPKITTEQNIARYREQLDKIGFSFDWDREVRTSNPDYYKWTQWIFIQLFNAWYNKATDKTEKLETLIKEFEANGNTTVNAVCADTEIFSAADWKSFSEKQRSDVLMNYRMAYLSEARVNWCPALGTVLANDEVKDGVSERGGYPVEQKLMQQWSMRITAYAQRLLDGLDTLDWPEPLKESQRYWIGKSEGTSLKFSLIPNPSPKEKGEKQHWETADASIYDLLKKYARQNRQPQTEAEDKLWQLVRNNQLGFKIRRQHPIGTYIADFICLDKKLIIEIDGAIHNETKEYDENRTAVLNQLGFEVIRFTNNEIENNIDAVVASIKTKCASIPSLLERGQGGEAFIEVFTTRPDTIFGVSFVTLAPEHELVDTIVTAAQKAEVDAYVTQAKNRSERERQADVKRVSGVFSGAYVIHPFTQKQIPIWIGDYVLAGYGTGAVMAVPGHDSRDYAFAKHFNLPITEVVAGGDLSKESYDAKEGKLINSDFLNGLDVKQAIKRAIEEIEKLHLGKGKINFRLRDAVFGRQRYWGEPIPIYYKDGIPHAMPENELPLVLPEVDKYLPTESGEPPLARAKDWKYKGEFDYEWTTMPGWAGSSWYFLRYMDAHNDKDFASKKLTDYWKEVDLYIGGSEHATGHLLYVRFWTKALKDLGYINIEEPAKKLINQGMIQGVSQYHEEIRIHRDYIQSYQSNDVDKELRVYKSGNLVRTFDIPARKDWSGFAIYKNYDCKLKFKFFEKITGKEILVDPSSKGLSKAYFTKEVSHNGETKSVHTLKEGWLKVEQHYSPLVITDVPSGAYWDYKDNEYNNEKDIWKDLITGEIIDTDKINPLWLCKSEVEKMSKSKYNVVTPDDDIICPSYQLDVNAAEKNRYTKKEDAKFVIKGIVEAYGTDTLRLYEMFLGPLEQSKPWNTNGITGVHGFLKKLWRLFYNTGSFVVTDAEPSKAELKALHKSIKKITEDIERFSFNTSVSNFMILVNELTDLKCNKRAILEPLLIILSPYAPHITEELWKQLGHRESITNAPFPMVNEAHLVEDNFAYPISFNGKMRFNIELPLTLSVEEIEKIVLSEEQTHKYLEGKTPKKIIIVPKKIVNIVM